jgi:hypothetical protein
VSRPGSLSQNFRDAGLTIVFCAPCACLEQMTTSFTRHECHLCIGYRMTDRVFRVPFLHPQATSLILGAVIGMCCLSDAFLLSGNTAWLPRACTHGKVSTSNSFLNGIRYASGNTFSSTTRARVNGMLPTIMKLDLTKADPKDVRVLVAGSTG